MWAMWGHGLIQRQEEKRNRRKEREASSREEETLGIDQRTSLQCRSDQEQAKDKPSERNHNNTIETDTKKRAAVYSDANHPVRGSKKPRRETTKGEEDAGVRNPGGVEVVQKACKDDKDTEQAHAADNIDARMCLSSTGIVKPFQPTSFPSDEHSLTGTDGDSLLMVDSSENSLPATLLESSVENGEFQAANAADASIQELEQEQHVSEENGTYRVRWATMVWWIYLGYCDSFLLSGMLTLLVVASFEEDDEDGSLHQESVANGDDEAVQIFNSTALPDFGKVYVRGPDSRTVHDIWQEYAHGLNGQEPLREKERRGSKWRRGPIDPETGKRRSTLRHFWCRRRPIYLFVEMRIALGDSEAVAVETCQEIVDHSLTRSGCPNWEVLCPLLRGVVGKKKNAVTTCQEIFNKYLTRNGRPIRGIVGDQVQSLNSTALPDLWKVHVGAPDRRTVHDLWQEYAHGLNGQEPLREKERRGKNWRQDPIDPMTGKRELTLMHFWSRRLPIYLFIEMRIAMGDSEAVALETCQEIVSKYLTRTGCPNWNVLGPLLRGMIDQEKRDVPACQQTFHNYQTRNDHHISGIVGDQSSSTVDWSQRNRLQSRSDLENVERQAIDSTSQRNRNNTIETKPNVSSDEPRPRTDGDSLFHGNLMDESSSKSPARTNSLPTTLLKSSVENVAFQVENERLEQGFNRSRCQPCSQADAAADAGIQKLEQELHILEEELKNENQLLWEEDTQLHVDALHKPTREATARASGAYRMRWTTMVWWFYLGYCGSFLLSDILILLVVFLLCCLF
jgi:hypothetical protein